MIRKKFSMNLSHNSAGIHPLLPLLNLFLWEEFTLSIPSIIAKVIV
jgi:hypothetical protein